MQPYGTFSQKFSYLQDMGAYIMWFGKPHKEQHIKRALRIDQLPKHQSSVVFVHAKCTLLASAVKYIDGMQFHSTSDL